MTADRRVSSFLAVLLATSAAATAHVSPARAQAPPPAAAPADKTNDAESHFRRGVLLYKEGDYAAALVEFRRAYELSPNFRVLYNIGQSSYQLQHYAAALKALEAYLAQGGTHVPAARRTAVESDLKQLGSRVGHVTVTSNAEGAEVRVDDEPVGTTPLHEPVLVSVGHRRITVAKAGRVPLERFVDVSSGDEAKVEMSFPVESAPVPAPLPVVTAPAPATSEPPPASPGGEEPPRAFPWVPWVATGVLAAASVTTGVITISAKNSLSSDLGAFPGDPSAIDSDRSRARTMATVTDVLVAATVVSAGLAVYFTLARGPAKSDRVGIGVGPQGIVVRGSY